jgi:hypothetical protein
VAPSIPLSLELHERSMRRYFEDLTVGLVRRRGGYISAAGEEFIRTVRLELDDPT